MARRTVTLDEQITKELDEFQVLESRELVWRAVDLGVAGEEARRLWVYLAHSVDELGADPSSSAVLRQALDYYLVSIREARRVNQLEAGYAVLAQDEERDDTIRALRSRMPERTFED